MTMTMMELYDIIVGYEVEEDFTEENRDYIRRLSKTVLAWVQKKLPGETLSNVQFSPSHSWFAKGYGGALDINNEKSVAAIQLREYLDIIESRWRQGMENKY